MPDRTPGLLETLLLEAASAFGETVDKIYDTSAEFSDKFRRYVEAKVEGGLMTAEEALRLYEEYQARQEKLDQPPKPYIPPADNGKTADEIRAKLTDIEARCRKMNGT